MGDSSTCSLQHQMMAKGANIWIYNNCLKLDPMSRTLKSIKLKKPHRRLNHRCYATKPQFQDVRPFRMAVIGSGPAGFYTAYRVMSHIKNSVVDMYEHLPAPYGLVRSGVAPDHPEVKNCQIKFEEVAESSNFNFIGNMPIADHDNALPLKTLVPHYDALLFAYGASKDRKLGLDGEELNGIYSARAFVGWYNGSPEFSSLNPDLTQGNEAIVIGQGNVALDVARILLKDPEVLRSTDITDMAIHALKKSRIERVRIMGRRGPMQASFTIKEIRELMQLKSASFNPIDLSIVPNDVSNLPRAARRIMEVLKKGSASHIPMDSTKSWSLDFCQSPTQFNGNASIKSQLESVSVEKTALEPSPFEPMAKAYGTGEVTNVPTSLVFRSIGYQSEALPGFSQLKIPFNDRLGVIPNDMFGRVITTNEKSASKDGSKYIAGMYCAGWVKRGPTGVIASTMVDAFSTADAIIEDWYSHKPFLEGNGNSALGWDAVKYEAESRGCRRVCWADWKKIDSAERARGRLLGKEREKFTSKEDMLAVIN